MKEAGAWLGPMSAWPGHGYHQNESPPQALDRLRAEILGPVAFLVDVLGFEPRPAASHRPIRNVPPAHRPDVFLFPYTTRTM